MKLPNDVIDVIYNYSNEYTYVFVNRYVYDNYKRKVACIIKIQKWLMPFLNFDYNLDCISKSRLVNLYARSYEWEFLKKYPTFLVKKCKKFELQNYAEISEEIGTKLAIINFLNHEHISKDDILYAGW